MPPPFRAVARVSSLTDFGGVYLHIPFCRKKCAYCDFYSAFATEELLDRYVAALIREIEKRGDSYGRPVDSVYFGGGTPSLLGERIEPVLSAVRRHFDLLPDTEITAEANPSSADLPFLQAARRAGVNRLSLGIQSGRDADLQRLGRTHTAKEAEETFFASRDLGYDNISVDLMAALPDSSPETLAESLDFVRNLDPEHISVYLLKIEPNTKFFQLADTLNLPDEDEQAEQYLQICAFLEQNGYRHYEISNFAKAGYESRHNLKYWRGAEYLGIGPAAHSFVGGRRFYYPRDLKRFCECPETVADGFGGDFAETVLLRLRLAGGIDFSKTARRFGVALPQDFQKRLDRFAEAGFGDFSGNSFYLTDRGMLVSNQIIGELLEDLS